MVFIPTWLHTLKITFNLDFVIIWWRAFTSQQQRTVNCIEDLAAKATKRHMMCTITANKLYKIYNGLTKHSPRLDQGVQSAARAPHVAQRVPSSGPQVNFFLK